MKRIQVERQGYAGETALWAVLGALNAGAALTAPTSWRRQLHFALAAGFLYSAARSFVREQVMELILEMSKEAGPADER